MIEIGPGELVDRLSILDLKVAHAPHVPALVAARDALAEARARLPLSPISEEAELANVNADLWAAEDAIRRAERRGDQGPNFTALARRIMELNDRRSALKALIDRQAGLAVSTEIKIYDR
ncbi:hypothetical protein DKT77_13315 [Meridianimarinicoccus roseus]|uniref:Uncharacterized protein n=1 Tax=Meridianimarinicoccus roseus TaxID=2072018 RepID=A0A2V2L9N4_9RHOB|nr:DUF6165 family protein [Meridianimarinicoccus roseus]PWR02130.1 hypothetical protein DKT77_13315 [Meridianimarinicoccus roseus]